MPINTPPCVSVCMPTKAHASGVSLTLCSSISSSHAQTHYSHALSIRPSRSSLGRYYYTTDGPARRPAWSAVSGTRLRLTAVSCVDLGSSPCQDCRRRHIGYYPVRWRQSWSTIRIVTILMMSRLRKGRNLQRLKELLSIARSSTKSGRRRGPSSAKCEEMHIAFSARFVGAKSAVAIRVGMMWNDILVKLCIRQM